MHAQHVAKTGQVNKSIVNAVGLLIEKQVDFDHSVIGDNATSYNFDVGHQAHTAGRNGCFEARRPLLRVVGDNVCRKADVGRLAVVAEILLNVHNEIGKKVRKN
jgi:hypothetical protein